MSFLELFQNYRWDEIKDRIASITSQEVEAALAREGRGGLQDFMALVSPRAASYLDAMIALSHKRTLQRFGRTMQFYIPMYLSNECQNICTYCGFSYHNKIERITLTHEQILKEVEVIKKWGFDHLLLVSGEAHKKVGVDYFEGVITLLRDRFSKITLEVQPLDQDEYERLTAAGMHGVLVYQETYHQEAYKTHHPKGKKSNFEWRLETPERLGKAGVHQIGLGVLLGLEEFRTDAWFCALHLSYLRKRFWKTKYSLSFPRLRPAEGVLQPKYPISDSELMQLFCAFRLFDDTLDLSLSTRENRSFRDRAVTMGVTSMSAGSSTEPGGYALRPEGLKQFEIADERSPHAVAEMVQRQGYDPVFKDWDCSLG